MITPTFVIVGHVNRGKSSVVSTLAADESVLISATPGTTKKNRCFPMRIDGEVIYELIDSPGFERPRAVMQWLQAQQAGTAERRDAVQGFVETHAGGEKFKQECELLKPVLAGAAVLYVIDGSVPFSPSSEAEMQILQWSGQPRMALINMTGTDDYTAQWQPVLDQYFRLIRTFNAHQATFVDRIRLIRSLREIHEPWENVLNKAIDALADDRRRSTRDAAEEIAIMLGHMLTLVLDKRLESDSDPNRYKDELAVRFRDELRRYEKKAHRSIEDIYRRAKLVVEHNELESAGDDLFSESTWTQLGLSRNQLIVGSTFAGAVTGGVIDAGVGGASFGIGTVLGGIGGAAASYFGLKKLEQVKIFNQPMGGKLLKVGPLRNPNFPWIVLDRALAHHAIIANCPHARREVVRAQGDGEARGRVATLPADQRKRLEKCFAEIRKCAGRDVPADVIDQLAEVVEELLADDEAGV